MYLNRQHSDCNSEGMLFEPQSRQQLPHLKFYMYQESLQVSAGVLFQKLIVAELDKKFPASYGSGSFTWCLEAPSLDLNPKSAESNPHPHVSSRLPLKIIRAFSSLPCVLNTPQNALFVVPTLPSIFLVNFPHTCPFSDLRRQLTFIVDVTLLRGNYDT